MTADGKKIYALGDVYPHADMVTYPSLLEGFGNAFLESVYYRRPIVINNYTIYAMDIKPTGFRVIEFDGYINDETVEEVRKVLKDRDLVEEMAEHNYNLAEKFFSFEVLERQLPVVLQSCLGSAK
jgi:glycosyltransferase involved in cell wall biosynthesis